MFMLLLSPRTSIFHFTSVHFKTKSLNIYHVSSLHITSFIYTQSPLEFPFLVTTFLTLFLKEFSLQGEEASKPAVNFEEEVTERDSDIKARTGYKSSWKKKRILSNEAVREHA